MKRVLILTVMLVIGVFSVNAQDLIILKNGNVIEGKVMEISPTEIRYKRLNNLNGPMMIIPADNVLSIRYENGITEVINEAATGGTGSTSSGAVGGTSFQQTGLTPPLQMILNALPTVPVAGNNLKFEFSGDTWTARVNGENFSTGTIEFETTSDGGILKLKQTHIWPGAVGRTAGRIASVIPGGSSVGSVLNTAGSVAGLAGAVEAPGSEIILEYRAGPSASLSLVAFNNTTEEAAEPVPSALPNQSFTTSERWSTFGINYLVPGLGSYVIMHDTTGAIVQWVLYGGGLLFYCGGFALMYGTSNPAGGIVSISIGGGLLISNFIYNIVRSSGYQGPAPARIGSLADPNAWAVAVLPGKDGIEQVQLAYTLRF